MEPTRIERARAAALRYARRVLPEELAEDVAQEVALRLVEGRGHHQNTRHAVIDAIRKLVGRTGDREAPRLRTISLDAATAAREGEAPAWAAFEEDADARVAAELVLEGLPPLERAALVLTALYELSNEEAGFVLGVTGGQVGDLLRRARKLKGAEK